MLVHPRYPDLVLVRAGSVGTAGPAGTVGPARTVGPAGEHELPARLRPYRAAIGAVVDWAWSYLCSSHPELGRRGPVCPYARSALTAGTTFIGVCPGRPRGPGEVAELLGRYRDWFGDLEPTTGREAQLKTIMILFPDLERADWTTIVDSSQRMLKAEYVRHGFMIGEFHDGPPDKGGLRNQDFRPLRSPVPMLVMRHMVATDLAFLDRDREFFEAYLERFADQVPAAELPRFEAAVTRFELETAGGARR